MSIMLLTGRVAKLADFGSSVELLDTRDSVALQMLQGDGRVLNTSSTTPGTLTNYVGSRWYRAPEVLGNGVLYGYSSDVWAFACTFAEFICGFPIFMGETEQDVLDSIVAYYTSISAAQTDDFLKRGLVVNRPKYRNTFHAKLALLSVEARSIVQRMFVLDRHERASAKEILQDMRELLNQHLPDEACINHFYESEVDKYNQTINGDKQ
jgi:serine/threonine protein kinase